MSRTNDWFTDLMNAERERGCSNPWLSESDKRRLGGDDSDSGDPIATSGHRKVNDEVWIGHCDTLARVVACLSTLKTMAIGWQDIASAAVLCEAMARLSNLRPLSDEWQDQACAILEDARVRLSP